MRDILGTSWFPFSFFLSRSSAFERFSFGRDLSKIFRPAFSRFEATEPASFGGNHAITDFLSAMWAFHGERLQQGLLEVKCQQRRFSALPKTRPARRSKNR